MIGILGLQGDFAAHGRALESLAEWTIVKTPAQLAQVDGLIIPGGESTTLRKLMDQYGMTGAIRSFHESGGMLFGTCAGLIILAADVVHPVQDALGPINVTVERNAYGRQRESFESEGDFFQEGRTETIPMVFIRAPRLRTLGPGVTLLARHDDEPVMVQQDRVLVATFHPELTDDLRVHRYFVEMVNTIHHSEDIGND